MRKVKIGAGSLLVGAFLVASAGTALAHSGSFPTISTTGVSFTGGYYAFADNTWYDFYYSGTLNDTASDGNNVFVHGKVAGYGYGPRLYSPGFKSQYLDDSSATRVSTANVQACQDRGTFVSDLCSSRNFYH